jgi:hypothetical protein
VPINKKLEKSKPAKVKSPKYKPPKPMKIIEEPESPVDLKAEKLRKELSTERIKTDPPEGPKILS